MSLRGWLAAFLLMLAGSFPAAAEEIRIGVVKAASSGGVFIAAERGYFRDQGIEATLIPFEAAQPIAVAVVTGDLDLGVAPLTAGFYGLAAQGELRLIAGASRDRPTYRMLAYLVSSGAYAAGLTAPGDLAGHSLALTQVGAPGQYALGLLAEKYGFDVARVRVVPLYSFPNIVSALAGNQVDAGLVEGAPGLAAVERGAARLLAWAGDETPRQAGGIFTATVTADGREDMLRRFLAAYVRGAEDYHAAFSAEDGSRGDGPTAPQILTILANHTGESAAEIARALPYLDPEARIDAADIAHQIAWYRAQHLLKGALDAGELLDRGYVRTTLAP